MVITNQMKTPVQVMYQYGKMCMQICAKYHRDKITYEQYSRYMQMIFVAATNEMQRTTEAMQQQSFSRGFTAGAKSAEKSIQKYKP